MPSIEGNFTLQSKRRSNSNEKWHYWWSFGRIERGDQRYGSPKSAHKFERLDISYKMQEQSWFTSIFETKFYNLFSLFDSDKLKV